MRYTRIIAIFGSGLLLTQCAQQPKNPALDMAVIGDRTNIVSSATTQGLVAFDEDGEIEPALAERWAVTDDGMSLVFRLARVKARNSHIIDASDVVRSLKESFATASKGRLGSLFSAIDDVVAMTDRVVEIRLKAPRPALLQLLAQPEFGIHYNGAGTGPYTLTHATKAETELHLDTHNELDDIESDENVATQITLRSTPPNTAVARFVAGVSQSVTGGSIADYPLVRAANIRASQLVIDPAQGLLGFTFAANGRLGNDFRMRQVLNMTIDRDAMTRALNLPGWKARTSLLPARYDLAVDPAIPDWAASTMQARYDLARPIVAQWTRKQGGAAPLRIAMPDTGLWKIIFARLHADWAALGIDVQRVGSHEAADLSAIDEVAPDDSVNWYFSRLSCHAGTPCDKSAEQALDDARKADTLDARATAYATADQAMTVNAPAIILGNPFRWSLTTTQAPGLHPSRFALHPLVHLR